MRGETSREAAQGCIDAIAAQPWFGLTYLDKHLTEQTGSVWANELLNDPREVLESVNVPLLILYGGADLWVPVEASMALLAPILEAKRNLACKVIARTDHAMMTSSSPHD